MKQLFCLHWLVLICLALTGCTLQRSNTAGDISGPPAPPLTADETDAPLETDAPSETDEAAAEAVVRLLPAAQQFPASGIAVVNVQLDNVDTLASVDLELQFNPAILAVQDSNPDADGIQIEPGELLVTGAVVRNEVDNAAGLVRYAINQPASPVSGGIQLARILFQSVGPGSSQLDFSLAQLINGNNQPTPLSAAGAEINAGAVAVEETLTEPTKPPPGPPEPTPVVLPPDAPEAGALPPVIEQPVYIPTSATFGVCYRTQPGETLYSLGHKFGTTAQAINVANDLYPDNYVKAQQTLFIPLVPGYGPNAYQVQLGDTLEIIAERCKLPVSMLARVNNLAAGDPLFLRAGQRVTYSDGASTTLTEDTVVVYALIIPIPPYPPPSRYQYPKGPIPLVPYSEPYPIKK